MRSAWSSRAALAAGALSVFAGCDKSPEPCTTVGTCPDHTECLANRCVPLGSDPVDLSSERLVLWPRAFAVVDASGAGAPAVVTFGGTQHGSATLYLDFAPEWRRFAKIDSAFLLLEPAPATLPSAQTVEVSTYRIARPWSPGSISAVHEPELAMPSAAGLARTSPPSTLRIDITPLVRYLAKHPRSSHGLAIRASTTAGAGASYSTGAGLGRAPRLEVYGR